MYQTLLGAWPLESAEVPGFRKRMQEFMVKALREARVHTNWARPDVPYERAMIHFIKSVTKPAEDNAFLSDFLHLFEETAYYGALNSLAQQLLKITIPGVPDFYQGSELWDFRLVDPDNRGPVDFEKRVRLLAELQREEDQRGQAGLTHDLLDHWQDGRIKIFVISRALNFRRAHAKLFMEGAYQQLPATGARKGNVFAFVRNQDGAWAVIAVPRLVTKLAPAGQPPVGKRVWAAGALHLPQEAPTDWVNILTGEKVQARVATQGHTLPLAEVFGTFPVALLTRA